MDGWDGAGYQKCPSMFFILCGYIEHVYVYLYIFSKNFTNILMGLKIWCQVGGGVGVKIFKITIGRWLFYFLGLKVHFLNTRTCCNFESHTRTQAPTVSLRGSGQIYTTRPAGPSYVFYEASIANYLKVVISLEKSSFSCWFSTHPYPLLVVSDVHKSPRH